MSNKHSQKPPAHKLENSPQTASLHWTPPGVDINSFPAEVQTAIIEIVNPIYEQLVLQARDSLEKSTGMTAVYLLWMEILNLHQLGQEYLPDPFLRSAGAFQDTFSRQLQLVDAKAKTSYILVRLRELSQKLVPPTNPVPILPSVPFPLTIPSSDMSE